MRRRIPKPQPPLCGCGCGERTKGGRWLTGHWTKTPAGRRKNSKAQRGLKRSEEVRRNTSEGGKRKWASYTPEERERRLANYAWRDPAFQAQMRLRISPEARKAIGEARRGRTVSEETRRKLSETRRRWWARQDPEVRRRHLEKMAEGRRRAQAA